MERRTVWLFIAGMTLFWSFFSYAIFPTGGIDQALVDRGSVVARSLLLAFSGLGLGLASRQILATPARLRVVKGAAVVTGSVMLLVVFGLDQLWAPLSAITNVTSALNIALLAFSWAWASDLIPPTGLGPTVAISVFCTVILSRLAKIATATFLIPEAPFSALFPALSSFLVLGVSSKEKLPRQTTPSIPELFDSNLGVMLITLATYDVGSAFFRNAYTQGVPTYESINSSGISWAISFAIGIIACAAIYRIAKRGATQLAWISLSIVCLIALYCIALFGNVMPQLCNDLVISARFFAIVATWAVTVAMARSQHISSTGLVSCIFVPLAALTRIIIYGPWQIPGTDGTSPAGFIFLAGILASALALTLVVIWYAIRQAYRRPAVASKTAVETDDLAERLEQRFRDDFDLTRREYEVLCLLSRGYSQKKIAETLVLSVSSIQSYSKALYRKLGIHSKQEAIDLVDRTRASLEL